MSTQGIDYAGPYSTVNRDSETGIRYGVISTHALHEWFYEAQEMDYGDANCPECGNKVIESCRESIADKEWNTGKDFACEQCEQCYWSDSVYPDEAQGWHIDDGDYKVIDCLDSDAMVIESPYFTYAQFCSPCVPGACSMDSPVDPADIDDTTAKCYCFGHDWFDNGRAPYPVYSVETGEIVCPETYDIRETVDGRYMVLRNGFQQFGTRDASGAGNATFATRGDAYNAILADEVQQ